ncbi:NADP-dependent oxidoreductase [Mesobaculum littorinae]|uniref:NADP-dependent oxidoreductase n=1 Tax=Mesobaculum littorinae TaxID=2486419 RepID=A0A438AH72_9RHOB|nr:NADP-dependent oxidoreductase [Mesobaculum littorinae]RVV98071.1 NADP-dependent oxidoreductase [Mesobaculum littorinae]
MADEMLQIRLASRPDGRPTPQNFDLDRGPLPQPGDGEMLVRVIWLSLDPYMRGRMSAAKSYADPVEIGDVMEGAAVGEVVTSKNPDFAEGDVVTGRFGWVSHAISDGTQVQKLDPAQAPVSTALGVLGMPGMTAWTGLNRIIGIKKGETVLISAATGAVGAVAGQIAKAQGCRVIGVAGGPEKCAYAEQELGYDVCLDHKAAQDGETLAKQIAEAAPDGIDGYFENVGGKTLMGVLPNMAVHGRIAICGMISWYNGANMDQTMPLPKAWSTILTNRLKVEGFLVPDHWQHYPEFVSEAAPMVQDGRIKYREDVTEGLENAPEAFIDMLEGGNFGKKLIRVGADA